MASVFSKRQSHSNSLQTAQRAPQYLEKEQATLAASLVPFLFASESPALWTTYEELLLACLRTGDDRSAHLCLERLILRFGSSNERAMGLRGLYQEATAEGKADLEKVLKEYNEVLKGNPTNIVSSTRDSSL